MTKKFAVTDVSCLDASKSAHPISTGIGYLDHMIDQLNSHAQVGVSVTVIVVGDDDDDDDGGGGGGAPADTPARHGRGGGGNGRRRRPSHERVNRYAGEDQSEILSLVGMALGRGLGALLLPSRRPGSAAAAASSRFRCPLDEALVECSLSTNGVGGGRGGGLVDFTLPPYGIHPPGVGRTRIGALETRHARAFFDALARSSGLSVSLRKVRGENGHHVVESAFKALSRAFRNLLDGTDACDGPYDPPGCEAAWHRRGVAPGPSAAGTVGAATARREGMVERSTGETSISAFVRLSDGVHLPPPAEDDGDGGGVGGEERIEGGREGPAIRVETGISTLDRFVSILAREAGMSVDVKCEGDLYVDDHHTSEDVSIALGQALDMALGTRAGLNRMWCAAGTYGGEYRCHACLLLSCDRSKPKGFIGMIVPRRAPD
jgi:imidazoleglycerol phosphate dehydratase HisB